MNRNPVKLISQLCIFVIITISCSSLFGVSPATDSEQPARPLPPFREKCICFEALLFGEKVASSLNGHTLVETDVALEALEAVQVAARSLSTGDVQYTVSKPDGSYEVGPLAEGGYEVWTCLDGFDELRFRLTVDHSSIYSGIDLHLRASEVGAGSVAVVPIKQD